ncbi:putative boron transporter 1-like isoform X1 [Capsicum annuum]|nr:putative boron transporter 1-like isoform X1 [Capsicum annuum]KAF3632089.1 putative boron transporter 1-like isoform X1 [Capsicum annuum]
MSLQFLSDLLDGILSMGTPETATGSLGPRYTPDDPTLPQPWKGLVDGANTVQQTDSQGQQIQQAVAQQGQQMTHMSQHPHASFMPQLRSQMIQQPGHQMPSQMGQIPNQPGPHVSQSSMQQIMPHQLGSQEKAFPSVQMGQPHGYQFSHHQAQHVAPHQISAQPTQALQFGDSSVNFQQPSSLGQWQQNTNDSGQKPLGPRFPDQMGSSMTHGHEMDTPPVGSKGFEENPLGRGGNDYYYNSNMDGRIRIPPQQPKLAAIPVARNQHEMRMGDPPLQNPVPALPSGFNSMGGPPMPNMYGQAAGGSPFLNPNLIRPLGATHRNSRSHSSIVR